MPQTRRVSAAQRRIRQRRRNQEIYSQRTTSDPVDPQGREQRLLDQRAQNTRRRAAARGDPAVRSQEQAANTTRRAVTRADPGIRVEEQAMNTARRAATRADPAIRIPEQAVNTTRRAVTRADPGIRVEEQAMNTARRAARRRIPNRRAAERNADTLRRSQQRRSNPMQERTRNRATMLSLRRERIYNQRERAANRVRGQSLRASAAAARTASRQRVSEYRTDASYRTLENLENSLRNQERREERSSGEMEEELALARQTRASNTFARYFAAIKKGPTEVCICCGGLWFELKSRLSRAAMVLKYQNFPVDNAFYLYRLDEFKNDDPLDDKYPFCGTCYAAVNKGRIPNICLANGLQFPVIPAALQNLTDLEERLVAIRIPFMRIIALGYERQSAIKGAVVNVPIPLDRMIETILPRQFNNCEILHIHLKRRLSYNGDYIRETIRPQVVRQALEHLVTTELYIKYNVTIDDSWQRDDNGEVSEIVNFDVDPADDEEVNRYFSEANRLGNNVRGNDQMVVGQEEEIDLNPGGDETLLDNVPVGNHIAIAPGEGQIPIFLLRDLDAEELSFPAIFCGIKRQSTQTYSRIARSQIRRYDRRCARVDMLLWSYKYYELSRVQSSIGICLRKKSSTESITAANLLNNEQVTSLINQDAGYHLLKGLRSSPAYWEGEKKKVMAMIRQFGLPSFFITLSAAESRWSELLIILKRVVDKVDFSEDQLNSLTHDERARLIRTDPVTCSRYFDRRLRELMKCFKNGVFQNYELTHFYWRIEFQHRGSPHSHGMYWLKDAPILDTETLNNVAEVEQFIDKFVVTEGDDAEIATFLKYQIHRHRAYCNRKRGADTYCRFNFPHPPFDETRILTPFEDGEVPAEDRDRYKSIYNRISNLLNTPPADADRELNTLDDFLTRLTIQTREEYIMAIRSSINKITIFHKRKFTDRMLNAYNRDIIRLQQANIDIQFILDPYACCSYIINYINKSNRGVSLLLREAMDEIRQGNQTIRQQLQHIGNKFINATEISAQEAAYNILGLHMSQTSHAETYINTNRPEDRTRMVLPKAALEQLPPDSPIIFVKNVLDHYVMRPDILETVCLADFVSEYKYSKKASHTSSHVAGEEEYEEEGQGEELEGVGQFIELMLSADGQCNGYVKKRAHGIIIRWRNFSATNDEPNFYRELFMLFRPWRDEERELLNTDLKDVFMRESAVRDLINANFKKYNALTNLQEAYDIVYNNDVEGVEQRDDEEASRLVDAEFGAFVMPQNAEVDVFGGAGIGQGRNNDPNNVEELNQINLPVIVNEIDLKAMVRSLNEKQMEYFAHVLHNVKYNTTFLEYVGGGAGVGKSRLISALYQAVTYRTNKIPGIDFESIKVMLCAFTGKAAFNIGGVTLHSLFSLPPGSVSAEPVKELSASKLNTLHTLFRDVKVIIIDEISMVGAKMLLNVHRRLLQIYKRLDIPFAGVSIIAFGDFKQLAPVFDPPVYSNNGVGNYGIMTSSGLWKNFKYFELTEIMRQRGDRAFATALNNMSEGVMTETDIELFRTRTNIRNVPDSAINLFFTNDDVSRFNSNKLAQINTPAFHSIAEDHLKGNFRSETARTTALNIVKTKKLNETQSLMYDLLLKTTAKYMLTINVSTGDGLVNGATGRLMQIDLNRNDIVSMLWMRFDEPRVGVIARRQSPHPENQDWTPIRREMRTFPINKNLPDSNSVERKQFPIVPAEAITIHKSQGGTYSEVIVNLNPGITRALMYVACSRATSASGLYLVGSAFKPPKKLLPTEELYKELVDLKSTRLLRTTYSLVDNNDRNIKLFYLNAQSLNRNMTEIQADQNILGFSILCFVETWTTVELALDGFNVVGHIPRTGENSHNGISVYANVGISDGFVVKSSVCNMDNSGGCLQMLLVEYNDIAYIVVYKSPRYTNTTFQSQLLEVIEQYRTENPFNCIVVVGDMNICRRTNITPPLESSLINIGLTSGLGTELITRYLTQIDWLFSNATINATTYETIFSDHDAIVCTISNES